VANAATARVQRNGRPARPAVAFSQLFLAKAAEWAHRDGTAQVRVHVALTTEDADGYVWALRGSSQLRTRTAQVVSEPSAQNRLLKTTAWVVERRALVRLHRSEVIRVTGTLEADTFNKVWDKVEAVGL
jgi:hypothetical protein